MDSNQSDDVDDPPVSFSVVIATHDRKELFRNAYESVLDARADYRGRVEVLVANSGPDRLLGGPLEGVVELHLPGADGAVEKRNRGIEAASGDWVVFVDDDCVIAERTFDVLRSRIRGSDSIAGLYPVTEFDGERRLPLTSCEATHFTDGFTAGASGDDVTWGPFTLAAFDRDALLAVGKLDEAFTAGGEDIDLGVRLADSGYRLRGIEETLAYHVAETWNSFEYNTNRFYRYGEAEVDLQRKHRDRVSLRFDSVPVLGPILLASALTIGIYQGTAAGMLMVPLFLVGSLVLHAGHYARRYDKSVLESFLLRIYDWIYAAGKTSSAIRHGSLGELFVRSKRNLQRGGRLPFGRDEFVYPGELRKYGALVLTITVLLSTSVL